MGVIISGIKDRNHTYDFSGDKAKNADLKELINSKIKTDRTKRQNYFLFDGFIRSNSALSLGNAETNNLPWTVEATGANTAVWGIQDNQAYIVSKSGGASIAWQETFESDVLLEVDLKGVEGNNNGGIAFRISDKDNFYQLSVHGFDKSICLYKWVAGVKTEIIRFWDYANLGSGKLSVICKGNTIEAFLDGFTTFKKIDSFNINATKHGLVSAGTVGTSGYLWKNFSAKPVGVVPLYVNETFDAPISKWYFQTEGAGQPHSLSYSTEIKETVNDVSTLRLELRKTDTQFNNAVRSELKLRAEKALEEHWYGVSIFLPDKGDEDYIYDTSPEILMQWHHTPDASIGETDISPEMALVTQEGDWKIWHRSDAGRISTNQTTNLTIKNLGSYKKDKGKWVKWVFHIKWGYLPAHEPITEVYKDEVLVYSSDKPNTFNNQIGTYAKFGIYKWDYKENYIPQLATKRVAYFNNYFVR